MKALLFLVSTLISAQLFAATVELGKYTAVAKEFPEAKANLELMDGGLATLSVDAEGTPVNCNGTYNVIDNTFRSHVYCDNEQVPEVNVIIDITNVTADGLRSEAGVEVPVIFDLMGEDAFIFILKKVD